MSIINYKTIRSRLFIQTSALLILFSVVIICCNTFLLETYYRQRHISKLVNYAQELDLSRETSEQTEFVRKLQIIASDENFEIFVFNALGQIEYVRTYGLTNEGKLYNYIPELKGYPILGNEHNTSVISEKKYGDKGVLQIQKDQKLGVERMVYHHILSDGGVITIATSLSAISTTIGTINTFIFYVTAMLLGLGGLLAFIISKKFSEPILEINQMTKRIASLDFKGKCANYTIEELDQLGTNINYLSEELEGTIQSLNEELNKEREVEKMRKEFISNVSHELKTPISIIDSYAEALKYNINSERKDAYCDVIIDETEKMHYLVKELLDLSNINSNQFKLNQEVFNIKALLDRVINKYQPSLKEKEINFKVEGITNVEVYADPVRIEQVLSNYLNNAISYMDENKEIKIMMIDKDHKIRIEVFNSAPAIDEKKLERIWESFYRSDESRGRSNNNYGLGLSIVSSIMKQHKNDYGVYNTDKGPVFYFEIDKNVL